MLSWQDLIVYQNPIHPTAAPVKFCQVETLYHCLLLSFTPLITKLTHLPCCNKYILTSHPTWNTITWQLCNHPEHPNPQGSHLYHMTIHNHLLTMHKQYPRWCWKQALCVLSPFNWHVLLLILTSAEFQAPFHCWCCDFYITPASTIYLDAIIILRKKIMRGQNWAKGELGLSTSMSTPKVLSWNKVMRSFCMTPALEMEIKWLISEVLIRRDCAGQSRRVILLFSIQFLAFFDLCFGSLFCWKIT